MKLFQQKENQTRIITGLCVLLLLLTAVGTVQAQNESYKVFFPCLVDLKGWDAEKPDGAAVDMLGMAMTSAQRSYEKGDQELEAMIMIGNPAMTGMQTGVVVETSDLKSTFKKIEGFKVHQAYDKEENSGSVSVVLKEGETDGAYFILTFDGMDANEGLKLAKKFDWKKMAKLVKEKK